jgi:hypothetical protein
METITKNVKDIGAEDRLALEHFLGRTLAENQQVVINVVNLAPSTNQDAKTSTADRQIPDCWKIYEGLSDEDVDRLDVAIRERANLTRSLE